MVSLECFLGNGNVSMTLAGMVKWLRLAEAEGLSDVRALLPSWIDSSGIMCAVLQIARSHDLSSAAEQRRTRRDDASAEVSSGGVFA